MICRNVPAAGWTVLFTTNKKALPVRKEEEKSKSEEEGDNPKKKERNAKPVN